jgi:hypothetical protein
MDAASTDPAPARRVLAMIAVLGVDMMVLQSTGVPGAGTAPLKKQSHMAAP